MSESKRSFASFNTEEEERRNVRPRAIPSDPQERIEDVPGGFAFFALINRRGRVYIPSTKNSFGVAKVSKVLCDSGFSSLLIPIESSAMLTKIFEEYNDDLIFRFEIVGSSGVGGDSLCLKVSSRLSSPHEALSIHLGRDILGGLAVPMSYLRFSLCSQDIEEIRRHPTWLNRFLESHQRKLSSYNQVLPRRTHALLGQAVLKRWLALKHLDCEVYFVASSFSFPDSLQALEKMLDRLTAPVRERLPEHFNDWEDDLLVFTDEEDYFDGSDGDFHVLT
eukprot:gene35310-42785_t